MCIPFCDKRQQPFRKMFFVRKIGNAQPFALQNREPLLYLVHPGAMHGRKVKYKAWMLAQPGLHLLALVHPEIIEHHMNQGDCRGNGPLQMLQKGDEFPLPLALGRRGIYLPRPRIKTRKQIQRTFADILMLNSYRSTRLRGHGRRFAGPWLHTGFLV